LYDVFDEISAGELSAADAADIFGSRAGTTIVNAVNNGTLALDDMVGQLEAATGTIDATAEASKTLSDQWTESTNKIKAAFTDALEPTISEVSSGFAGIVGQVGDYLDEHPTLVNAISAVGAGLGTAAVAIAGVLAALGVAKVAAVAFGGALSTALAPITAIAAGVAAVSAAVLILKGNYDKAYDSFNEMDAITRQQSEDLEDLQSQYDDAVSQYGEFSDEASELKYQIDDLSDSIANNGQSVDEYLDSVDALIQKNDELMQSYQDTYDEIDSGEKDNLALIAKLENLATSTDRSAASQEAMQTIIDELNGSIDGLDLSYSDLISDVDGTTESVKAAAQAYADQLKQEAEWQDYIDTLQTISEYEDELATAQDQVTLATDAQTEAYQNWQDAANAGTWQGIAADLGFGSLRAEYNAASDDLEKYQDKLDEVQGKYDDAVAHQEELEEALGITDDATNDLTDDTMSYADAVNDAYAQVGGSLEDLAQQYADAYDAAYESFSGQFGLFDEAQADMDSTVESAQAALDSQLAYWDNYLANIETLSAVSAEDLGITQENYDAIMSYVQDGGEEAAGLAASMVEAIDSGNSEAVTNLADTLAQVTATQQEAADVTAQWQTDFTDQMQGYADDMAEIITDDLDLSDEAAEVAKSTIESYADQITKSGSDAVTAAQGIADQVAAALNTTSLTNRGSTSLHGTETYVNSSTNRGYTLEASGTTYSPDTFIAGEAGPELIVSAHANGTTNGENFYMAGENGPELIVGEPGSEVFPSSETEKIVNAVNAGESASEKKITLEIVGSGSIDMGGGVMPEDIWDGAEEKIKSVFMSLLRQEVYEEGDAAYGY
ncbi:MAG: hypothetical protein LUI02_02890, partial [Clostridiales bacterium]|nr:hypothetical protein [Clostridiales bacterium]